MQGSGRNGRRARMPVSWAEERPALRYEEQGLQVRHLGPFLDELVLDRKRGEMLHLFEHSRVRRRSAELHFRPDCLYGLGLHAGGPGCPLDAFSLSSVRTLSASFMT